MISRPLTYFTILSIAAHAALFGAWSEPERTSALNQEISIEIGLVVLPTIDMEYSSEQVRLRQPTPQKQVKTAAQPQVLSSKPEPTRQETTPAAAANNGSDNIADRIAEAPHMEETAPVDVTPPGSAMTGSSLLVATEAAPRASTNPAPQYPAEALRYGWEGEVWLKVDVDQTGGVYRVRVDISSGYPVLDRTAIDTVKRWIFEPARIGQETIDATVRVPVRFKINRS